MSPFSRKKVYGGESSIAEEAKQALLRIDALVLKG
jgi:hypothetical protein